MQPGWCQPVAYPSASEVTTVWRYRNSIIIIIIRQEFMKNECEALPGVAYPRVRDNRSILNTKTGYDDDDDSRALLLLLLLSLCAYFSF